MGKLLHQLQLLRESSHGWAQPPQTHSPTDFCQNRISYLSHICHDKTRNSSVSLRLEKGKTSPRNQDKPLSCLILSHLQGNFFLYLTSDMFGSYLRTSITGGSVCLQFGNFVTSCLLRYDSYLLILMII